MLSPGESSLLAEAVLLQMAAKNPLEVKLFHSRFGPLCGKVTCLVLLSNEKDLMGIDFSSKFQSHSVGSLYLFESIKFISFSFIAGNRNVTLKYTSHRKLTFEPSVSKELPLGNILMETFT